VLVFGDGQDAVDGAVRLAQAEPAAPRSVGLVHRRDSFKASDESIAQMRALCASGRMALVIGQPVSCESAQGRLSGVQLVGSDGVTRRIAADRLVALLGLSPKLGPIAEWGLGVERKQVPVDTEKFETQVPGIYAVGDINHYPGKRKLIVCGFHEATLAAYAAAQRLRPDGPIALQYTTTSPKLHRLLGVAPPAPGG
jgi:thioredoxin reductase (NADPH)